jgi:hypothetical protein
MNLDKIKAARDDLAGRVSQIIKLKEKEFTLDIHALKELRKMSRYYTNVIPKGTTGYIAEKVGQLADDADICLKTGDVSHIHTGISRIDIAIWTLEKFINSPSTSTE